ncbi:hypothetical protein [Paradevosia shaoguanensis]|uniref:Uncharacterized protein n=1 Tax=Paradevosia shaoguanensis TaxID=1335043 RepID=A0AA41QR76_9HYPH|nr:hypothetical protein [Paradevosia shaoguanensis]MCF1744732.1 hypothetical protein [Paradevosia shaoguanensis]MCI0129215.1 hypothetical protein [Paradevosia shaoguanensis]
MTPEYAIAVLDRQIAAHGQPLALRRGTGAQHNARGFIRGYKPDELIGLVSQADRNVTISPSSLGAYGLPKAQDDFSSNGQRGKVEDVEPIHIGETLVRVNLRVRLA